MPTSKEDVKYENILNVIFQETHTQYDLIFEFEQNNVVLVLMVYICCIYQNF